MGVAHAGLPGDLEALDLGLLPLNPVVALVIGLDSLAEVGIRLVVAQLEAVAVPVEAGADLAVVGDDGGEVDQVVDVLVGSIDAAQHTATSGMPKPSE